jgi:hypothetical protein
MRPGMPQHPPWRGGYPPGRMLGGRLLILAFLLRSLDCGKLQRAQRVGLFKIGERAPRLRLGEL